MKTSTRTKKIIFWFVISIVILFFVWFTARQIIWMNTLERIMNVDYNATSTKIENIENYDIKDSLDLQKYNQREQKLVKDLLGVWTEIDSSNNDIDCGYEYEFSIMDNGSLIYNSWNHCRPMDSGTWSINENTLYFNGSADSSYGGEFKINGNYLDLGTDGYFKKMVGDSSIDDMTRENVKRWEDLINK